MSEAERSRRIPESFLAASLPGNSVGSLDSIALRSIPLGMTT